MDVAPGALRRGVATVRHGMNRQLADACSCSPADQSAEMVDVAVDAAIGAEAKQVQFAVTAHQPFGGLLKNLGGLELLLADSFPFSLYVEGLDRLRFLFLKVIRFFQFLF